MPDREFLETYPLYRRLKKLFGFTWQQVPKAPVTADCSRCGTPQTFLMINEYWEGTGKPDHEVAESVVRLMYTCASCKATRRYYLLKFGKDGDGKAYCAKVGQYPPWDITTDPIVERMLGDHADIFRKGLVCESQSYGIGAFAYYRRIVELTIDELLAGIADLLGGQELARYQAALEKSKSTTVTEEKIQLVKDLLPPVLRPDGLNPLAVLHNVLSDGIHRQTDEECIAAATNVRQVLVYLVNQVSASRASSKAFTESMRKLLEKKTGPERPGI